MFYNKWVICFQHLSNDELSFVKSETATQSELDNPIKETESQGICAGTRVLEWEPRGAPDPKWTTGRYEPTVQRLHSLQSIFHSHVMETSTVYLPNRVDLKMGEVQKMAFCGPFCGVISGLAHDQLFILFRDRVPPRWRLLCLWSILEWAQL